MLKKILLVLLILLIAVQFIQPPHNNGQAQTPTDITHSVPVPDSVMAILQTSCYDCHSNHTNYPWYSKITPVNWWLNFHINQGKKELNFSVFASYSYKKKSNKLEETAKEVDKLLMPLPSYLWIHKNAKLNDAQRKLLMDWARTAKRQVIQDSLQKSIH